MEFNEALQKSLKSDKHTHSDPFLLHSRVSDLVGNDYEAKNAAEEFYHLDAKYEISKTILGAASMRYKKRKKHFYKIKPIPLPPDNAYVYFNKDDSTIHLSGECPCLKGDSQIYRTTCDRAKMLDFKKKHLHNSSWFYKMRYSGSTTRLSKNHKVHICHRCGDFTPRRATGIFYRLARWIWDWFHIDLRRKFNYSPSSFELLNKNIHQNVPRD